MDVVAAKIEEKDLKSGREIVLRDFARFAWRATRGLSTSAEADAKNLVRSMSESGRITKEEGERLMSTLLWRMRNSRQVFEARVNASVRKAAEKLADVSAKEMTRLSSQVSDLERKTDGFVARKRGK